MRISKPKMVAAAVAPAAAVASSDPSTAVASTLDPSTADASTDASSDPSTADASAVDPSTDQASSDPSTTDASADPTDGLTPGPVVPVDGTASVPAEADETDPTAGLSPGPIIPVDGTATVPATGDPSPAPEPTPAPYLLGLTDVALSGDAGAVTFSIEAEVEGATNDVPPSLVVACYLAAGTDPGTDSAALVKSDAEKFAVPIEGFGPFVVDPDGIPPGDYAVYLVAFYSTTTAAS